MRSRCVNKPYSKTTDFGWIKGYPLNKNGVPGAPPKPGPGYGFHTGVDYVTADRKIKAPQDSTVTARGYDSVNGNYLVLQTGNIRDWFAHIAAYTVVVGDIVKKDQHIAYMGATGAATGIHVHHSVRKNGVLVDAEKLIKEVEMPTEKDVKDFFALLKGVPGQTGVPTKEQIASYTKKPWQELAANIAKTIKNELGTDYKPVLEQLYRKV